MRRATLFAVLGATVGGLTIAPSAGTAPTGPKATASSFPSTVVANVPPNGNAGVTSPTLPADATRGKIIVKPAKSADEELFEGLELILAEAPTRSARVLTCVFLAATAEDAPVDFGQEDEAILDLFLYACVRMAIELNSASSSEASAAASGMCQRQRKAADAEITRSGGTYRMQVEGTTRKPSRRSRVIVTCREKGTGVQLRVRPRKRGRTLRKVVGKKLGIGLVSPADATRSVKVRTTFRAR